MDANSYLYSSTQYGLLPKWPQDKNGLSKVKTAPSLFTNDTSSFNNSAYHVYACNTHTVIMHAYEVKMYYVACRDL